MKGEWKKSRKGVNGGRGKTEKWKGESSEREMEGGRRMEDEKGDKGKGAGGKRNEGVRNAIYLLALKGPLARVLARHFHQEMALERNCNHRTKKKEGSLAPNQRGDIKINGTKRARFSSIRESIGGGEPAREEGRERGDERD